MNITANFQECRLNPSCTQLYVNMYRYERNGVDATSARTTANYQPVQRIQQPSDFSGQQYTTSFYFTPENANANGFYLGFRDNGTCVNLLRLQVYYILACPDVDPPLVCPKIGRPPQGSTVPVTCSCPPNSTVTPGSSLQLICHPNGTCTGNPSCQCKEGHQEITGGCRGTYIHTYMHTYIHTYRHHMYAAMFYKFYLELLLHILMINLCILLCTLTIPIKQ